METDAPQEKKQGGNKKCMIIGIAVVGVLVIVGVVLAVVLTLDDDDNNNSGSTSGGDSGTTTVNLEVSAPAALNNLEVATFIEARESKRKFVFHKAIDPASFADDADYNKDTTRIYVDDSVQEPIRTVQSILCQIDQAGIGYFMPVGDTTETYCYLAQVDESLCNEDNDNNQPSFTVWTLCNTNDVEQGEYLTRVWLETGHGSQIYAHLKISHADISDDAIVPRYNVSWAGCQDLTDESTCAEKGYLSVYGGGSTGYDFGVDYWTERYWEWDQDDSVNAVLTESARGVGAEATDSGHGVVVSNTFQWDNDLQQPTFVPQRTYFGFEDQYLVKQTTVDGSDVTQCLDRDNPRENGNRYRVYTSDGSALDRNTGQSIFIEDDQGERSYGYASYWGVWGDASLFVDGATVKWHDWQNDVIVEATLQIFSGQMHAIERGTLQLDDIAGLSLSMHTFATDRREMKTYWDKDAAKFKITHERNEEWEWEQFETEEELVVSESSTPFGGIFLSSEGIGGHGWIQVAEWTWNAEAQEVDVVYTQPTGNTIMFYEINNKINPDPMASSVNLFCHDNCRNGADVDGDTRSTSDFSAVADLWSYTFDHANYVLTDESNSENVDTPDGAEDYWSVSFELWEDTTENREIMLCEGSSTEYCPSHGFSDISQFYRWETGSEHWNRATALLDGDGNVITFQRPLRIVYTHEGSTSNSGTDYSGNSFFLEVHSDHINNLPFICLDINQEVVDCDATDGDSIWRHVSDISIPEGTVVTDETDESVEYIIKPLEISQIMSPLADTTPCDSIHFDTDIPVPTSADYASPLDGYTKPSPTDVLVEVGELTIDCATFEACNENAE